MTRELAALVGILALMAGAPAEAHPPASLSGGDAAVIAGGLPQQPGPTVEGAQRDKASTKPGSATLRGRVFAADSGQPLRKAQVRLMSADEGRLPARFENQRTPTDAGGRYEFSKLPAGRYHLTAMKGGFVSFEFGQRRSVESGKPIDVLDGKTVSNGANQRNSRGLKRPAVARFSDGRAVTLKSWPP